jgi:hypothetical protein
LRGWTVNDSTITAFTSTGGAVVNNGTDDQGLCTIGIHSTSGAWYVFYAGNEDGSEVWNSTTERYYKVSTDQGATWSAQTRLDGVNSACNWLVTNPWIYTYPVVAMAVGSIIYVNAPVIASPHTQNMVIG